MVLTKMNWKYYQFQLETLYFDWCTIVTGSVNLYKLAYLHYPVCLYGVCELFGR